MPAELKAGQSLRLLHDIALGFGRESRPDGAADFTFRQLTVLLTIYLEPPPHTVRGIAAKLAVTKPVITRALDMLGKIELVTRRRDPADKRNVVVQRTVKGALYVESLGDLVIRKMRGLT